MNLIRNFSRGGTFVLVLSSASFSAAQAQYRLVDLGVIAFSDHVNGVNNLGHVVLDIGNKPYVYDGSGLHALATLGNGGSGQARAISDNGTIVGTSDGKATRWVNSAVEELPGLQQNSTSAAYDLDAAGNIVGFSTSLGEERGVRWTATGIENLSETVGRSVIYSVSSDGSFMAGKSFPNFAHPHGVVWSPPNNPVFVPFTDSHGDQAWVTGINNAGTAVGVEQPLAGFFNGIIYSNGVVSRVNIPPDSDSAQPKAIDDAGHMVGSIFHRTWGQIAGMYDGESWTDLNSITQVPEGSTFTVVSAEDISNSGYIAARALGLDSDQQVRWHAVLLAPVPEPGSITALAVAGIGLILRRRKKHSTK